MKTELILSINVTQNESLFSFSFDIKMNRQKKVEDCCIDLCTFKIQKCNNIFYHFPEMSSADKPNRPTPKHVGNPRSRSTINRLNMDRERPSMCLLFSYLLFFFLIFLITLSITKNMIKTVKSEEIHLNIKATSQQPDSVLDFHLTKLYLVVHDLHLKMYFKRFGKIMKLHRKILCL